MTAEKIETHAVNDSNREVRANGELVGWLLHFTLGHTRGWFFVASKGKSNQYPDSHEPSATWEAALAGVAT